MAAYYNEFDSYAAAWLRNLIAAGLIPPGDVDERSIADVRADDLAGYTQAHFFSGIGGWPYALRLAGWTDDRPVWTGSCPCQPFSAAGKRRGTADARHLWPEFRRLIAECRPPSVFGEQVASADGRLWLSGVRADLEAMGYAVGAADLCAAGVGAPHIRQRLWWVADANGGLAGDGGLQPGRQHGQQPQDGGVGGRLANAVLPGRAERGSSAGDGPLAGSGDVSRLGDAPVSGIGAFDWQSRQGGEPQEPAGGSGLSGWMGDADDAGSQGRRLDAGECSDQQPAGPAGIAGFWSSAEWLLCTDGKARRAQPGIFPLAHGVPGRVGRLRAYGNAIVPWVAAEFVRAFREGVSPRSAGRLQALTPTGQLVARPPSPSGRPASTQ